jgi:effector-binding domain-containing protein
MITAECNVREQPAQPILAIRLTTAVEQLPQEMGRAFGAIAAYLSEVSQAPAGPPYAAYYNMDMQHLDVEMGFPTAARLPGRGEIVSGEIAGGRKASCVHVGPYDKMNVAYDALTRFVQERGDTPTGVAYEFYLNDPTQTPAAELQTLVVFPLKR